jgi:type I restriction enzyme S subunit
LTQNFRERIKQGSGQPNLNTDIIKTTPIPLGELNEQRAIIKYIETKSEKINQAIAQAEKEIELIQEYRTTLISDAVTGKIDIRDTLERGAALVAGGV